MHYSTGLRGLLLLFLPLLQITATTTTALSTTTPTTLPPLDGPVFDEAAHLALQRPERVVRLRDFGLSDEQHLASLATDFAQTGLFGVLSREGMALLAAEIARLEPNAVESPRIPRVLRGSSLRSRFIHGLCHSRALAAFVSELAGTELVAHPMEIMNGHIRGRQRVTGEYY